MRTWDTLVDLVLPGQCAGCGRPGTALCERCLPGGQPVRCPDLAGRRVFAGARYEAQTRAALLWFKERGRRELAAPLAGLLAEAVAAVTARDGPAGSAVSGRVLLVPVPSSRRALRERGYDPVVLLARAAAARTGTRVLTGVLAVDRPVADSAGLGVRQRASNLDHAFRARSALPRREPAWVVIVDDIITTGTTVREACRALVAGGWRVQGAAAVAATPRTPARSAPIGPVITALPARHARASLTSPIGSSQHSGLA